MLVEECFERHHNSISKKKGKNEGSCTKKKDGGHHVAVVPLVCQAALIFPRCYGVNWRGQATGWVQGEGKGKGWGMGGGGGLGRTTFCDGHLCAQPSFRNQTRTEGTVVSGPSCRLRGSFYR